MIIYFLLFIDIKKIESKIENEETNIEKLEYIKDIENTEGES